MRSLSPSRRCRPRRCIWAGAELDTSPRDRVFASTGHPLPRIGCRGPPFPVRVTGRGRPHSRQGIPRPSSVYGQTPGKSRGVKSFGENRIRSLSSKRIQCIVFLNDGLGSSPALAEHRVTGEGVWLARFQCCRCANRSPQAAL